MSVTSYFQDLSVVDSQATDLDVPELCEIYSSIFSFSSLNWEKHIVGPMEDHSTARTSLDFDIVAVLIKDLVHYTGVCYVRR